MAKQKGLTKESLSMDMAKMKILGNLSMSNYYYVEIGPLHKGEKDPTRSKNTVEKKAGPKDFFRTTENSDAYQFSQRDMRLLCSEAVLPASAYATAEVKDNYIGVTQQFAHTRMYTDIDLTFYIDKNYRANMFFETWMNYVGGGSPKIMSNMEQNYFRRMHYPSEYKTNNIKIYKFEKNMNESEMLMYQLKNAFPKALSSTTVSYGPAELLRITVTLGYDYYSVNRNKPTGTQESFRDQFGFEDPDSLLSKAANTPLSDYERQGAAIEPLFQNY